MPKLYWESIEKGEQVTPVSKPAVTRVQIAKFAGASQDWSPLHLDDDFAKSAGYGGVFAHGAIALSFATEALGKWLENGRVLAVSGRFRKLVWPGDILRMTGMVAERYELNDEARIDVDVWAENQNHDSVMQGTITCVLWRNEKDERKSKTPWPPLSPKTIKDRRTAKQIPRTDAEAEKAREAAQAIERARNQSTSPPRGKSGARAAQPPAGRIDQSPARPPAASSRADQSPPRSAATARVEPPSPAVAAPAKSTLVPAKPTKAKPPDAPPGAPPGAQSAVVKSTKGGAGGGREPGGKQSAVVKSTKGGAGGGREPFGKQSAVVKSTKGGAGGGREPFGKQSAVVKPTKGGAGGGRKPAPKKAAPLKKGKKKK